MASGTDIRGEGAPRSSIEKPPILSQDPAFDRLPDEIIQQYAFCPPALGCSIS